MNKKFSHNLDELKARVDPREMVGYFWGQPTRSKSKYDVFAARWRDDDRHASFTVYASYYFSGSGEKAVVHTLLQILRQLTSARFAKREGLGYSYENIIKSCTTYYFFNLKSRFMKTVNQNDPACLAANGSFQPTFRFGTLLSKREKSELTLLAIFQYRTFPRKSQLPMTNSGRRQPAGGLQC